ncbi:nuclear transport factor 2 family protein [Candidatus Amarobacter glycogenicus]|uniref:nuclear transport factor 2 family protein n=1 Tax=Candidatus Amarobacter glycogenicus TaxID=3140699 RepID=UPI002A12F8EB|nr:nuclear transport factor 2 family protein [Dehalococcoidia bacterium]MBK8560526.1 nuclear transport factor 2 family protein [Dehalococcoidia bacterium]MBK9544458.1 nuclear transport factor 2 family protein [Dehalococcoidia bacterium]MBK9610381.1 nuclear transport factor 2 family protein [Dehalococcoidia bacterium]
MALSVEDQLAIQQLYAKYNHAIDSGDGVAWAATFTPDATFVSASGTFTGTEALTGFGNSLARRFKLRHWTNNLVLEGSAGEATGSCYLVLYRLTPGEQPPASILTTAIYKDELARGADGAWLFTKRAAVGDS